MFSVFLNGPVKLLMVLGKLVTVQSHIQKPDTQQQLFECDFNVFTAFRQKKEKNQKQKNNGKFEKIARRKKKGKKSEKKIEYVCCVSRCIII